MEYAENIVQLLADLVALLLCLFHYISNKRRGWFYAIIFFLCNLLSCYYWTAYLVLMGSSPNVSDLFTHTGWNIAFFVLFVFLLHMKTPEERKYFHPLMLLPVPLNVWQLTIYLPYGSLWINLYQVGLMTLIACFSLQGILWYRAKRNTGAPKPYVPLAVLLFTVFEFGMWTSSSMAEPYAALYYPFSILSSVNYLFLVWAVSRTFADEGKEAFTTFDRRYQNILKASSLGIVLIFSLGGILLGVWMRDEMTGHLGRSSSSGLYDIIPVMLFVFSLVLMVFVIAVIFVVIFGQRAAENNKLREATQIAERSSAAKSEFLANMSHEIRTPINAVMGMNEIILRESLQARDRMPGISDTVRGIFADICSHAGVIDSAGKNLLAIINDILDISKIEAGRLEIHENEYQLSAFLGDICNLIAFRASSHSLDFHVEVDSLLPDRLFGDEIRIRQVILNILNNAIKYTRRGSVTLSVTAEGTPVRKEGETVRLVFSVRDTGIGIRKENLSRIFDKFERLEPTENSHVEGTGLGLPICKNLLEMMNGSIHVESVYGEGSLFSVTIPQKVVSEETIGSFPQQPEAVSGDADAACELFRAPEARILIVDDTRMNLTVAEGLLRKTGIRIDTALSGEIALQLTLTIPYDLILMDQRMPEMDGTETMRRIRAQEGGANLRTPVVCLTADAISGARERYLADGFTDYLSKPIDSYALRQTLIRFLLPEKVIRIQKAEDGAADKETARAAEERFSGLRAAGIDVREGLFHCQNDETLYRSVLCDYAGSAAERLEQLHQYYESSSWKDYGLLIHTIKSTSATIGAAAVSSVAARMETAAKAEDTDEIHRGHAPLLTLYHRTANAVRVFCAGEDPLPAGDDDVIEFMPE